MAETTAEGEPLGPLGMTDEKRAKARQLLTEGKAGEAVALILGDEAAAFFQRVREMPTGRDVLQGLQGSAHFRPRVTCWEVCRVKGISPADLPDVRSPTRKRGEVSRPRQGQPMLNRSQK